jgi:hypothetical protein
MCKNVKRARVRELFGSAISAAGALALLAASAAAHDGQHDPDDGHIFGTGAFGNVQLVGKVRVHDAANDRVSDVAVLQKYAYLGAYAQDTCAGPEGSGPDGGVYVIDISNPVHPREVGFIPAHQDTYVSEGVQALHIDTPRFDGDILVLNNEGCGKNYKAGLSIWNITNPLQPRKLFENIGDFTTSDVRNAPHDANQIHSAFAWDAGSKAYVVMVDDDEAKDIDIVDITDPRRPKLIAEFNAEEDFPLSPDRANGDEVFLHDMVVKQINGRFYMLLSYWDAGWIVLDVTDPASPVFVDDSDYPFPDPVIEERLGLELSAEGNGHQAEWSFDNRFIIGTDEDFSPYRAEFAITSGPNAGTFQAGEFGFTAQIALTLPDGRLNGPTIFGGYGCPDDIAEIPPATALPALDPGEEKILVLSRGPVNDPSHPHDACFFDEKIQNAADKGYDAVIIANHHVGSGAGTAPDAAFCGSGNPRDIMAVCIGHRAYHLLFNTTPSYSVPYAASDDEPTIGAIGADVAFTTTFDGWGYVRLLNADTLQEIDEYAIPQAFDENFASGFGALSVHEVATDPDRNVAYLSYYSGGFRAIRFGRNGIVETGGYIDSKGNDFWGVEVWKYPGTNQTYILASDLDSGLWIFRLTN